MSAGVARKLEEHVCMVAPIELVAVCRAKSQPETERESRYVPKNGRKRERESGSKTGRSFSIYTGAEYYSTTSRLLSAQVTLSL